MTEDIRWKQRYDNFTRSLRQLESAFATMDERELNDLEKQGVIQAFEYNYELAWNVIKDFYKYQGPAEIQGSRDAFKLAFNRGLIKNGDVWMDMIEKRQLTSHTYKEEVAKVVLDAIIDNYYSELVALKSALGGHLRD